MEPVDVSVPADAAEVLGALALVPAAASFDVAEPAESPAVGVVEVLEPAESPVAGVVEVLEPLELSAEVAVVVASALPPAAVLAGALEPDGPAGALASVEVAAVPAPLAAGRLAGFEVFDLVGVSDTADVAPGAAEPAATGAQAGAPAVLEFPPEGQLDEVAEVEVVGPPVGPVAARVEGKR